MATLNQTAARPPPTDASWLRRVGCVTTGRADAGIYRPLLQALAGPKDREVLCFAGGSHFAPQFGGTINELQDLAGVRLIRVDHAVSGDRPADVAETAGRAVTAFGRALAEHPVDLLFVLGDRTEMLAAALAATIHALPLAHLHGGDRTAGAYDDACRQAITKLSHLHFPAMAEHAARIQAMGEEDWRIHAVGALALDAFRAFSPEPPETLNAAIGLDLARPTFMVAFHPETLAAAPADRQIEEVLAALGRFDAQMLLIGPNADVGHSAVQSALARFTSLRPKTVLRPALGQHRFWSCLTRAQVLVGNSSAGLLEAASFRLPVVNIGDRQSGRVRPANVLDAPIERAAIAGAIELATKPSFRENLADLVNPYGDGHAAERIVAVLLRLPRREALLTKA